jgi:hypothetical protein
LSLEFGASLSSREEDNRPRSCFPVRLAGGLFGDRNCEKISPMQIIPLVVGLIVISGLFLNVFGKTRKYSEWIEENFPVAKRVIGHPRFNTWLIFAFIGVYGMYAAEYIHVWMNPALTVSMYLPAPPVNEITMVFPTPITNAPVASRSKSEVSYGAPAIENWPKKLLKDKTIEFAEQMREYAATFSTNEQTITEQAQSELRRLPPSDTEGRNKIWSQLTRDDGERYKTFTLTIMKSYYQPGQMYRNELLRRLGPQKPSPLSAMGIFGEAAPFMAVINPQSVLGSATELENLANQLH